MKVKERIYAYLKKCNKPKTVAEISESVNASHGYVRERSKELMEENKINGKKSKKVPGCVKENGDLIVLSNHRSKLIEMAKRELGLSKSFFDGKASKEIRKLLRKEICEETPIIAYGWVFWT